MSVNWSWREKQGVIHYKNGYSCNIYRANCLGAIIYEFKDKETGKEMYSFYGYWADKNHLKKNLGLIKNADNEKRNIYRDEIDYIEVNTFFDIRDKTKCSFEIAECFAKAKYKVNIYYEEVKYEETSKEE